MKRPILYALGAVALAALGLAAYFFMPCSAVLDAPRVPGSHGFRIIKTPSFQSFEHQGKKICVPEGWEALGARNTGDAWARFENDKTGVLIRSNAFLKETLTFQFSSYEVTLVYPEKTDAVQLELYRAMVRNAFERTGALFQDSGKEKQPHTVLVSAGIEGTSPAENEYVYPDPGRYLSVFVRPPYNPRGEELFIHAVAHLYNRFRTDLSGYQNGQSPIPAGEFEELEATWAETAFRTSDSGRLARLRYLYNVHTAVQTKNFSLITEPPFDNKEAFDLIRPSVAVPDDGLALDYQYGHYILAPLSMVATDGLLKERDAETSVEKILTDLHTGNARSFFEELGEALPVEERARVQRWMLHGETIPWELVQLGATQY